MFSELKFCERLTEVLKDSKYKQNEIAEMLHIDESNISQYKVGATQPSFEIFINLCQILDVSADYLLGLTDEY